MNLINPTIELWFLRILVLVIIAVAVYAVARERFRRNVFKTDTCPRCGGTEFHRLRRTQLDRLFGMGMKIHRYRCKNPDCEWEGLLQGYHSGHHRGGGSSR